MRIASGVAVLALSVLSSSPLFAQGRSNASRGQSAAARGSRAQRAVSSRQQVLDRVLGRTQGTPRNNAAASNRSRIPDVNALRRSALQRVGAQSGTGRVNREFARGRARGLENRATARDRSDFLRRSGVSRRPESVVSESDSTSTDRRNNGRRAAVSSRRDRLTMTQPERLLAKRLASIDHLRDIGLRNGNVKLIEKADQLELLARQQFDRRTDGTKMDVPSIFRRDRPTTRRPTTDEETEGTTTDSGDSSADTGSTTNP